MSKDEDKQRQWRQFAHLGDLIGMGEHYESPWILKEYKALAKILIPKTEEEKKLFRERRQAKNKILDDAIAQKLTKDRCKCGGQLKQTRSGAKTVKCVLCDARYKYGKRKK